jgi:chorismate mutase
MSLSSRTSNLARYRESLLQLNSEILISLQERRRICLKIQELKSRAGAYPHYDAQRELEVFELQKDHLLKLSIKELLSFSLLMEDQAMALAPGSYPSWSLKVHMLKPTSELFEMINPLLLKVTHPEIFNRLEFVPDFDFLRD